MVTQAAFVGQIGNLPALDSRNALRWRRVRVKRALNGPTDLPHLVKVHFPRCVAQGVFQIGLFHGNLGGQALEIGGSLTLQSSAIVQPAGHFHRLVDRLSDAFGPAGSDHTVQVSVIARADGGGQLFALLHVAYLRG
jgi:hypothetical protein